MVSVWYVANFVPLAFYVTLIRSLRPFHPQRPSLQQSLYFFLYVSYFNSLHRFPVTSVITIRQSRISTRATIPLSIFSSVSNYSSADSTYIRRFHLRQQ